jgi:hypothetical protein
MNPRKKPTATEFPARAKRELLMYGALQQYKPGMAQVISFWQDIGRPSGLPEKWRQKGPEIAGAGGKEPKWRVYLEVIGGFYTGFAESLDGGTLRFLMIVPIEELTERDALKELCSRV